MGMTFLARHARNVSLRARNLPEGSLVPDIKITIGGQKPKMLLSPYLTSAEVKAYHAHRSLSLLYNFKHSLLHTEGIQIAVQARIQ